MAWTSVLPDWTTEPVRSEDLQTMVDVLTELTSSWTPYDVTWSSSGTQPSIVNGTLEGRYRQLNKTIDVHIRLIMGPGTTFGTGQYFLSLPEDARVSCFPLPAYFLDSGTANKVGMGAVASGLGTLFMIQNTTDVAATAPHTWANGDRIDVCGTYEVA